MVKLRPDASHCAFLLCDMPFEFHPLMRHVRLRGSLLDGECMKKTEE